MKAETKLQLAMAVLRPLSYVWYEAMAVRDGSVSEREHVCDSHTRTGLTAVSVYTDHSTVLGIDRMRRTPIDGVNL